MLCVQLLDLDTYDFVQPKPYIKSKFSSKFNILTSDKCMSPRPSNLVTIRSIKLAKCKFLYYCNKMRSNIGPMCNS